MEPRNAVWRKLAMKPALEPMVIPPMSYWYEATLSAMAVVMTDSFDILATR